MPIFVYTYIFELLTQTKYVLMKKKTQEQFKTKLVQIG